jgi:hypothetical protein
MNMQLDLNIIYTIEATKNTVKTYFDWLGYSMNDKQCFLIWSELKPEKSIVMLSNTFIKNKLLKPLILTQIFKEMEELGLD